MRPFISFAALVVAAALSVGYAQAQTPDNSVTIQVPAAFATLPPDTAQALATALANGDAQAVGQIVLSVEASGNAAQVQAVASVVASASQALATVNPSGAAVLAAIAFSTGTLNAQQSLAAASLAVTNTTALSIIANPSAAISSLGVTTNPVLIAQNGANVVNTAQANSGSLQ